MSERRLPYPLNRSVQIEDDTPLETVVYQTLTDWNTNDPNERVRVVFDLSLNEYIELATMIDVGRDIAYPNTSVKMWQLWVSRLVSMAICDDILDCIENGDADYISAINRALEGDVNINGSSELYQTDALEGVVTCDSDSIYGYCRALWLYIHQQNVDFLEQLNEATNQAGQINTLLSFIPLFEQVPISDTLAWIENLGEYNLDAYNASYTTAIENEIICELFCIANQNCTLTMDDVYNVMLARFGGFNFPTLGATFLELVVYMVTGNYPNDRIVYLWTLVQLGIVFVGAQFFNIQTMKQYALQAQSGDADSDWQLFCSACSLFIDFDAITTNEYSLSIQYEASVVQVITAGSLQSQHTGNPVPSHSVSWVETTNNNFGFRDIVRVELTSVSTIENVSFDYLYTQPDSQVLGRHITLYDSNMTQLANDSDVAGGAKLTWNNKSVAFNSVSNVKYIEVRISVSSGSASWNETNAFGFVDNIAIERS